MMLTEQELKLANLDNLTRLWQAMGTNNQVLAPGQKTFLSHSWPYRFWQEKASLLQDDSDNALLSDHLAELADNTLIPVWPVLNGAEQALEQVLMAKNYHVAFEQVAMVLPALQGTTAANGNNGDSLRLKICTEVEDTRRWTRICSEAFGYEIDHKVIENLGQQSNVQLLLADDNQQEQATALLFKSQYRGRQVTGIHQLGVPEKHRGRGIARRLMLALLAQCGAQTDLFTLQASFMGKGLYASLGFKEQFLIKNYRKT